MYLMVQNNLDGWNHRLYLIMFDDVSFTCDGFSIDLNLDECSEHHHWCKEECTPRHCCTSSDERGYGVIGRVSFLNLLNWGIIFLISSPTEGRQFSVTNDKPCFPSHHVVRFFRLVLGSSPGLLAATAASYCPCRAKELSKTTLNNLSAWRDGKQGTVPLAVQFLLQVPRVMCRILLCLCYRHIWLQWHQLQWRPAYSYNFGKSRQKMPL